MIAICAGFGSAALGQQALRGHGEAGAAAQKAVAPAIERAVRSPRGEPQRRVRLLTAEQQIAQDQRHLQVLGLYRGKVDGLFGPKSRAAVQAFQRQIAVPADGVLTGEQRRVLRARSLSAQGQQAKTSVPAQQSNSAGGKPPDLSRFGLRTIAAVSNPMDGLPRVSQFSAGVAATRIFIGPDGFPPEHFAAYGIIAFKSRAASQDRARHLAICEAYANAIEPSHRVEVPKAQQMVTVWPVRNPETALSLSRNENSAEVCQRAVDQYDLSEALLALKQARAAGVDVSGQGPFLLAWAPVDRRGAADAVVLQVDLSGVQDYAAAAQVMSDWVVDIERDPEIWTEGWNLDKLRLVLQRWLDRRGEHIFKLFGV